MGTWRRLLPSIQISLSVCLTHLPHRLRVPSEIFAYMTSNTSAKNTRYPHRSQRSSLLNQVVFRISLARIIKKCQGNCEIADDADI
ncbi:hypothetical protein CPB83DRAFT_34552 [Crepidotus variabilis]|uniref:Uncharacterized protein n=1 Tax=Crepidotus variabilis TaxID=179855 RepID=A0A9P6JWZ4_9AGAR|nr:hypothetical protein CPB83DRAFT_34552 [Crepidotus variabilis]